VNKVSIMRGMNNIKYVTLVPIGQKIREMYLETIIPFRLYLSFHYTDIPETPYVAPSSYAPHVSMAAIDPQSTFRLYLHFDWMDFPRTPHLAHSARALQTVQVCYPSITDETVLWEQSNSYTLSRVQIGLNFVKRHTLYFPHSLYKNVSFVAFGQ